VISGFSLNIGGSEWVVIILLGLFLLFGAKKLPQVSRSLGRVIGEYNRAKNTIQEEITQATKPFTTPPKFDSTPRLPTRQEVKTNTGEIKTEAATDTAVKAETSTTPSTANTDATNTSPAVSEREKLEVIARTLDIEPRGKSTDELKQLIANKMNQ
jgi:sec-independent protein translocase protein TatA